MNICHDNYLILVVTTPSSFNSGEDETNKAKTYKITKKIMILKIYF